MAHPPAVKAQALAMLILGDRVTYVAKVTGVPKQTVSRWKPEADAFLRDLIRSSPKLQAVCAAIRETLPGLGVGTKRDYKKKKRRPLQPFATQKRKNAATVATGLKGIPDKTGS